MDEPSAEEACLEPNNTTHDTTCSSDDEEELFGGDNDGLMIVQTEQIPKRNGLLVSWQRHAHTVLTVVLAMALGIVVRQSKTSNSRTSSTAAQSLANTGWAPLPDSQQVIDTIAFGSCMKQNMPQPFWDTVMKVNPQVTILAGDQVYPEDCNNTECTNLQVAYAQLEQHPSFAGAKARLPMVAILDDHDYGLNDCHDTNPYKDVAKDLFFDFYQIPPDDERRAPDRTTEGLYTSYEWGPVGQRVQLIVLDTRYSRSKFLYSAKLWAYVPDHHNHTKRMLSENQWDWLEHQVLARPANVRLVVSSVQVLTQGVWGFEHWHLIPHELGRLKHLLKKYCHNVDADSQSLPILLSGDRHIGAFYYDDEYDLNEVTASSWTHTIPHGYDPDGVQCATPEDCIEEDVAHVGDSVTENHFGVVKVDWDQRSVDVSLVRSETSHGYPVKQKWHEDTDAGKPLKTLSLQIP